VTDGVLAALGTAPAIGHAPLRVENHSSTTGTGGVLATLSTHPPLDVENQLLTMRVKWAGPTPRKEVSVRNLPPEKPSMLATFVSVFLAF
jgi:hypothetical protein